MRPVWGAECIDRVALGLCGLYSIHGLYTVDFVDYMEYG